MNNFLVHNEDVKKEMCAEIGINSVEDLFKQIPEKARMQTLELNEALSELQTQKHVKALAKKNKTDYVSF